MELRDYRNITQAKSDGADGTTNTGWDTFLAAIIEAGFAISGTWPMRTELGNRMIRSGTNVLASSIVLVRRPRAAGALAYNGLAQSWPEIARLAREEAAAPAV